MGEGGGIMAALDGGGTAQRDDNLLEPKHSIFLCHSGAQKSFVDQLCLDIKRHDRHAFFDKQRDSLSIGCNFPDLIFKAITQCQVAVVVLSEEFFSRSKWPMLELAAMVKRKMDNPKLVIMPVFLGLTHAQCRDPLNQDRWRRVWKGWAMEDNRIDLREWEAALKVLGYTNGISLNDMSDDVKCRGEIVEAICKEVHPSTRWDDSHVQGRKRLCLEICARIDKMQVSRSYGTRILGIYGVGGIGKTTACKVLCNNYFEEFEGKVCHVEFGMGSKLMMLQELLKKLTDTNQELIREFCEDKCKDRLKKDLKKKVFLAIDNVSPTQQIADGAKDLLRMGFMEGSIVIVTARSCLQLCNLNLEECMEMPELDEDDARSLFLYHAAPGLYLKVVDEKNEQLLMQCMKQCYFGKGDGKSHHYHPLALKVLGGQFGNDPSKWSGKLSEVDLFNPYQEEERKHPLYSILRTSFETLREGDQFLFMDAALFYPKRHMFPYNDLNIFEWLSMVHGKNRHVIKQRLEGLKSKSLLENVGDGSEEIGMHDLWREFAAVKSKAEEFAVRPWLYEKIYRLDDPRREEPKLSTGGGLEKLQRLCMVGDTNKECFAKELDLTCCSNLKVLKLVHVFIESEVLDVRPLRELKSLEILYHGNPSPKVNIKGLGCLRHLVFLHLDEINFEQTSLCEEIGGLTNLQVLHIRTVYSSSPIVPDFSRLNLLRDVCFHSCEERDTGMISGLSSRMTNLRRLDLRQCALLRRCDGVGDLVNLEILDLSRCRMLEELPNLRGLKQLLELDISRCKLIKVVLGFGDLVSLQTFRADECDNLAKLPDMGKLVNLQGLFVPDCPSLNTMPGLSDLVALENLVTDSEGLERCHDLSKLSKLERVKVRGWGAGGLVPCLSGLVKLKILEIKGAGDLTGLENLTRLQELEIAWSHTEDVECLSNLTALKRLYVSNCRNLGRLPDMHRLSQLESFTIGWCTSMRNWESSSLSEPDDLHKIAETLTQLRTLHLDMVGFTELPDLSSFPQLCELRIVLCKELTRLTSSGPLTALKRLELCDCDSLRALPDVNHLVSLSSFRLKGCRKLVTHDIAGTLPLLRSLDLCNVEFAELPDLSKFPQLWELKLASCLKLTRLTSSAPLTALNRLILRECGNLKALPDVSHLVSLKFFELKGCGELELTAKLEAMCAAPPTNHER